MLKDELKKDGEGDDEESASKPKSSEVENRKGPSASHLDRDESTDSSIKSDTKTTQAKPKPKSQLKGDMASLDRLVE